MEETDPIARNLLHEHQQITTVPIPIAPLRKSKFHPRKHLPQRDRDDTLVLCRDGSCVRGDLRVEGLGGGERGGEVGVEGGDLVGVRVSVTNRGRISR